MKTQTQISSVTEHACDALIVNLFEGVTTPGGATGAVDKALGGLISQLIAQEKFEGKLGKTLLIHSQGKIPAARVVLVGLGKSQDFTLEAVRRASAAAIRKAREARAASVSSISHGARIGGLEPASAAQATVEGALIASYEFTKYKSKPDNAAIESFTLISNDPAEVEKLERGARKGQIVAEAVNEARDLINTPASDVYPEMLAGYAEALAHEAGLGARVLDREECERMGMGAFLAVAKGSERPPRFIVLKHTVEGAKKTVAIVGKGVTFDTGGYCIKTAESMFTMKDDMSGAAAVLAAMRAVGRLKPGVNVMGIVAATENMISGSAYRPGDVVRAMNGKTIEIENTDAEGRVTLSDALSYAASEGADEIIDLATLTGACVVALGRRISGLFCNNDALRARLMEASDTSGDLLWDMPLLADYFEQIESKVADMKNTGGREAGATTAALLLQEFVDAKPWAHIDIAGPAFVSKDNGLVSYGGTGAGVRLLIEYLTRGQ
ncbi:MAG: leucyl aminopeptidase [Armatimonadetes bacterium]|nr:leucyl aminopeptidase [Armatimonadota bacterium]